MDLKISFRTGFNIFFDLRGVGNGVQQELPENRIVAGQNIILSVSLNQRHQERKIRQISPCQL